MSLTTLLKQDEKVINLFSAIPSFKHLFHSLQGKTPAFPSYSRPNFKRVKGSNPGIVGTAYDFWFRAYLQGLNNKVVEHQLPLQVSRGLEMLEDDKVLYGKRMVAFKYKIKEIWNKRVLYMKRINKDEKDVVKGSLLLAYCEAYMRSRKRVHGDYFHVLDSDFEDLMKLVEETKKISSVFRTNKNIFYNPTFGQYSRAVGGADADFIIGNTLFDIKTTAYLEYKEEYIWQLIGYYLLSKYDKNFPVKIEKLALFYPRFGKVVYISIDDIKKEFNLDMFSQFFYELIVEEDPFGILDSDVHNLKNKLVVHL